LLRFCSFSCCDFYAFLLRFLFEFAATFMRFCSDYAAFLASILLRCLVRFCCDFCCDFASTECSSAWRESVVYIFPQNKKDIFEMVYLFF
jgi:hypothetical protein